MDGTGMDADYKACSLCTHTCYNEHGFEVVKTPADRIPRHPCFLKTAVDVMKSWMPIPKEFVDLHLEKIRGSVDIEGPNGKVWLVGLGGASSAQVGFRLGWHAFITENKLQRGDQLLFTLVAKSRFTVHVFNRLGLETAAPPATKIEPTVSANGKRKREESEDEGREQSESEDSDDSEYESENESEAPSDSPSSESDRTGTSSRVKREKLEEQRNGLKNGERGTALKKGNGTCKSTSQKKKAASEVGDKQQMSQEPGWNSTTYESKRRPVTDAEREKTMKAASSFKSKRPSVLVLMKPSHVYRGFWLTIPNSYSKNHMPQERISIKLQDSFGFQWPAQWIKSNQHSGVSGGWAAFSRDHLLEEGDVCVFEVIDSEDWTLMVHIFRVLQVSLVPNTRGGWENNYNIVYGTGHPSSTASEGRVKRRGPKHKLNSATVKKNLAKALYSEVRKEQSTKRALQSSSPEDSEDVDSENELLTSRLRSRQVKPVQGVRATNSDEVDVKPSIASLGLNKKTPYRTTTLTATVKVEKDTCPSVDVKPTSEQLKASLKPVARDPICDLFQTYNEKLVKPEPMEVSSDAAKEEKGWYAVNRLISRRQVKDKEEKDFLVELEGTVVQEISRGSVKKDESGNWWVPSSLFSPDFSKCFIN